MSFLVIGEAEQRIYDANAAAYHGDVDGDCALV